MESENPSKFEQAKESVSESMQQAKERVQQTAEDARESMREKTYSGLEAAESKIHEAKKSLAPEKTTSEKISDGMTQVKDTIVETYEDIRGKPQE